MNYYIQGDAAKADKIKAAFEKKGYSDKGFTFDVDDILFFTANNKHINVCPANGWLANIIKTHPDYKELELPVEPKFKVGDWIASIDDEGDMAVERIVNLRGNKVLLVDTDGCFTEYPKGVLELFHIWTIADTKDGDVLCTYECGEPKIVFIHKLIRKNGSNIFMYYCFYNIMHQRFDANNEPGCLAPKREDVKPATKEQCDLLFAKMREVGYEWDADKKELRKIHPHYDIANFKPFDKVLVRCSNDEEWMIEFYCKYDTLVHTSPHRDYPFMGIGDSYSQCIPFNKETKHLLGTTDMPSEEYINW